ncbi:hypothetical protein [Oceanibacterium hippocampi]|uniref:VWA domain-containing protein n=1 Tax=Oceanibacterium hippocampi TaxID=745714 RepID=A0A1Y5SN24_9PROT|nr:hypothetical protein [Oceanibacterium hippocampi]SLN41522.1 hypothetical protein OCH7691_01761 [Oceanibacterium hippocampi]
MAREVAPKGAKSSRNEVDAFLDKLATLPPTGAAGRGRLMFALDATASRQATWDRACHQQAEMFTAAAELGGLDVKLLFYRGFGECKATPWVASAESMIGYMQRVRCLGGQTQIGRVLNKTIKETEAKRVNALIFVGDCMEEDVDELCHLAGKLGMLGVPIFLFHEGPDPIARAAFEQMARLSGGAYCPFDGASAGALRELLRAVAVYAAGGRKALEDLSRKQGGAPLMIARQIK